MQPVAARQHTTPGRSLEVLLITRFYLGRGKSS